MTKIAEDKRISLFCLSRNLLLCIVVLSIPCLSFFYSPWVLLILVPVSIVVSVLHRPFSTKKKRNGVLLEHTVLEGKPIIQAQEKVSLVANPETEFTDDLNIKQADYMFSSETVVLDNEEEDNLIEIALLGSVGCDVGVSDDPIEGQLYLTQQQVAQTLLYGSFSSKEELIMDIWAEFEEDNMEENLIEIDISLGSIISLKASD